jgi:hypothetical protein
VAVPVTVDSFVRAETDRMFAALQADAGGVNQLHHNRAPTPIDHQTVIRMNRDTLYSLAIVDISKGATVTIPESGDRYVSVMVVNQDHYINRVLHEPGEHTLAVDEFDTPWVGVGVRVLVDPADPDDVAAVNALQDQFRVDAKSSKPFVMPDYDTEAFDGTRSAVLELAKHSGGFEHAFGTRDEVDPVATYSQPRLAGAACPIAWPGTSTSMVAPEGSTRSPSGMSPSTASGRSPSTTPTASSSPTTATRTASTT